MRRNWMPLYIPDFLADTMHLTAAETGAYLCLIMDYWLHDGLPDDDRKLAQIARVPLTSWRQMRPTIAAFFRDGWRHKRVDAELKKMVGTMERRHAAATRAGNASWMAREKKAATKRSTDVQRQGNELVNERSTSVQPNVNHLTQESKTTSSFVGTARASEDPTKSISQADDLATVIRKKGWVQP
jgi:uncharacterized protein YdaU (DUF1376 family)